MPKMNISRSITIDAPAEKVFSKLNDLNHWTAWSPWLILEPETKVTVREDAKYYEWEGERTGSGQMTITSEKENEELQLDLLFLKPWKSKAKVGFKLKGNGVTTHVTWTMESSMPFFMFFMTKMMEAFVGMDYERGLKLLKDYVEDGKVHSALEIEKNGSYPGCTYVGITTDCKIVDLADAMTKDFDRLWEYMGDKKNLIAGNPISIYHKWKFVKGTAQYTVAVPVNRLPESLPGGFVSGGIPATTVYSAIHTGPYEHLGNAWSLMANLQRSKAFKNRKGIHPFEEYLNDPSETDPKSLKTAVRFAVK
ncbi:SRPBCC family protein [Roseivirga sp. UBA838]|uniref:SRPBCC family protein n=1 Tax=Roseivirga sp. UBA838 TaxID=1947393 RepID=UPI00257D6D95|nr:SRPBCC family protein [Roseivirga sp. UBA838]|tara:strand:- start:14818 stop:15741 length:924 start_codon:yes stop_codon:yes gene_type:complete